MEQMIGGFGQSIGKIAERERERGRDKEKESDRK